MAGPDRWNHPGWRLELPAAPQDQAGRLPHRAVVRRPVLPGRLRRPKALLEKAAALPGRAGSGGRPRRPPRLHAGAGGAALRPAAHRRAGRRATAGPTSSASPPTSATRRWASSTARPPCATATGCRPTRAGCRCAGAGSASSTPTDRRLRRPAVPGDAPHRGARHDHTEPQGARTLHFGGAVRPYMDVIRWSAPAGACWLPATVVPVGFADDGLPVGIQIIGPYLGDRTTLDLAARLFELIGGIPRPSGLLTGPGPMAGRTRRPRRRADGWRVGRRGRRPSRRRRRGLGSARPALWRRPRTLVDDERPRRSAPPATPSPACRAGLGQLASSSRRAGSRRPRRSLAQVMQPARSQGRNDR